MNAHEAGWEIWRVLGLKCAVFLSSYSQGFYTVAIAWLAYETQHDVSSVGLVLIWWNLLSLGLGPFLGVFVDRHNRTWIYCCSKAVEFATISTLSLLWLTDRGSLNWLILAGIINAIAGLSALPCLQAFIKASSSTGATGTRVAGVMAVTQGGLVLGAGSAGPIIALFGGGALFVCAAAVAGAGFAVLAIRPNLPPGRDQGDEPYIRRLHAGFSYLMFNRRLMLYGAGLTLAFSVGQATNALLPAFTAQILQQQAAVYGLLDALWSAGAICASVAAARLAGPSANKMIDRHGLVLMAAILAALGAVGSLAFSLVAQVLLGATFALCRIRFDALILENTPSELIGRVRSNVQAGIGLSGILIYLSPWATGVKSPSQLYIIYAIGLFAGAVAIYCGRRGTRSDEDRILTQTQF